MTYKSGRLWKSPLSLIICGGMLVFFVFDKLVEKKVLSSDKDSLNKPENMENSEILNKQKLLNLKPNSRDLELLDSSGESSSKIEFPKDSIPGDMTVRFKTKEAYQAFLEYADENGLGITGKLPQINMLKVSVNDSRLLDGLQAEFNDELAFDYNYVVTLPQIPFQQKEDQGELLEVVNENASALIGVPSDNQNWGEGVTIAVLDSGIISHSALENATITELDLVEDFGQQATLDTEASGHGTAVASLIVGNVDGLKGIAPAAEILSVKVLDGSGEGNTFLLAQGIIAAVESGANVLNLSLGTEGDSEVLRQAVSYALSGGVILVASAGNEGTDKPSYPAAYEGVIGVAATDANNAVPKYSNFGQSVSLVAPGYGLYAAWTDDQYVRFNGTSASAPIVSGAIAGLLSQEPELSASDVNSLLLNYSDDYGYPGVDNIYGQGVLNIDRIINRNVEGIYDASVSDFYLDDVKADGSRELLIGIQNRGTEILNDLFLKIGINGSYRTYSIGNANVGEVLSLPLSISNSSNYLKQLDIDAQIFSKDENDSNQNNDRLEATVSLEE